METVMTNVKRHLCEKNRQRINDRTRTRRRRSWRGQKKRRRKEKEKEKVKNQQWKQWIRTL